VTCEDTSEFNDFSRTSSNEDSDELKEFYDNYMPDSLGG
jgi:hypothetical protein